MEAKREVDCLVPPRSPSVGNGLPADSLNEAKLTATLSSKLSTLLSELQLFFNFFKSCARLALFFRIIANNEDKGVSSTHLFPYSS